MLVFGTRPEAIKMAPLYHELRRHPETFDTMVCVTAQHREMLDQVLKALDVRQDIDLDLMKPGQDLFDITAAVLVAMRGVLRDYRPDVLLVHGDTTTSLASAMAGFYAGVQVGHVEAGLRTHDVQAPFPEEFNRQVTSKVARWHFAPTETSRKNLLDEAIDDSQIFVTGNTVIDALFWVLQRIEQDEPRRQNVEENLDNCLSLDWRRQRFVLITGHRRENFGEGFQQICEALRELALAYPTVSFIYPVHLNPNVQKPVIEILAGIENVYLIKPLDYEPFVYLLKHAYLVLTDSGGIQEEAPSLGKPVLVMREVTERPEALHAGTVRLVGAQKHRIVANVGELIENAASYHAMTRAFNPYGDGQACARIAEILKLSRT
ncbi:MAG: UDP-N-acetylglucosamine 2-epimerase (non-hydrolyzing) [Gammaproteobacteria bacterium]|nr:UDP-N-acetylglucosamine 2-epimerase (non-hydrolyzing) [Gammaproteobacteria bacterium]